MRTRYVLGGAGILLALFGVFRILTQVPFGNVFMLLIWLVGAVILHDLILSPIIAGIGVGVSRAIPRRARRFVAPALVVGGLITVVALPMIYKQGSQPASKAILRQNYGGNLALLLGLVAAVALLAYVVTLLRERTGQRETAAHDSPPT